MYIFGFRHLVLSLVFALAFGSLLAEVYYPIPVGAAYNISMEGLVMRAGPGKSQARLDLIPYMAQVEVVETLTPKMDSLAPILGNFKPNPGIHQNWMRRIGYWAKVKWNGKIGYVLDIFLLEEVMMGHLGQRQEAVGTEINNSFVLFKSGTACEINLAPSSRYRWSGVYVRDHRLEIKPVVFRQYVTRMDAVVESQLFLHTLADDNAGLEYIIGSLESFGATRQVDLRYSQGMESAVDSSPEDRAAFFAKIGITFLERETSIDDEAVPPAIKISAAGGRSQILTGADGDIAAEPWLEYVADLDGDGIMDYIVTYGEGSSRTVLYLSRQAKKGRIVAPTAVWFDAYCC